MKHSCITEHEGVTRFHYTYSDLRSFLESGFRDGDVGMILVRREGGCNTYRGFGTTEHPVRHLVTITMVTHGVFDIGTSIRSDGFLFIDLGKS